MGLFDRSKPPSTTLDELTHRYGLLAADVERLRAQVSAQSAEWADVLSQVRKAIQRLERAQDRATARDRQAPAQAEFGLPAANEGPEHGFGAKLRQIHGQRGA